MAMKYRQQGYQDSEFGDRNEKRKPHRSQQLTPEERAQRRSLRHATDREANEVIRCPTCGRNIQNIGAVTRATFCPHCRTAIHCCRACKHFDSGARWECRADISEKISEKSKDNACKEYDPRMVLDATGRRSSGSSGGNDPKSTFDSLFKE